MRSTTVTSHAFSCVRPQWRFSWRQSMSTKWCAKDARRLWEKGDACEWTDSILFRRETHSWSATTTRALIHIWHTRFARLWPVCGDSPNSESYSAQEYAVGKQSLCNATRSLSDSTYTYSICLYGCKEWVKICIILLYTHTLVIIWLKTYAKLWYHLNWLSDFYCTWHSVCTQSYWYR